jgi:hypothetical protein
MSRPHRLRGNASSELPSRIVLLDTETRGVAIRPNLEEHRLRLFSALYWQRAGNKSPEREEWRRGTMAGQLWEWLDRRVTAGKRLVVIAHNTQFDLQALGGAAELARRGWTVTKGIIDAERVIFRVEREGRSMLWLDWYNYFRQPLERAADLLGVEYVPLPPPDAPDVEWQRRCDNDVRILRAAVGSWLDLLSSEDLGMFAPTLAAQALHAYRHRFMEHEILLGSRFADVRIERAAYMGGRCEALSLGKLTAGPYTLLDVNSAYAAVMGREAFPRRFIRGRGRSSRGELLNLLNDHLVVARVRLDTELPIWPARHEGRLVFPVGQFETTLTTPELKEAIRRRALDSVGEIAVYEPAPLFEKWVREIYALRLQYRAAGDHLREELVSAMLQALYGKFGEHRREWRKVADEPELPDAIWSERDIDVGAERTFRRLGGIVTEREIEGESYNSFPAIPAHVTAHTRLLLWRYVELAGIEHVHYLDTDALIVDEEGRENVAGYIDPARIGFLKVVEESSEVEIRGPKDYRFGERERRKGVRADAVPTPEGRWRQREFLGLNAALRRGHSGGPLVRTVERASDHAAALERVDAMGRVHPLRMG